MDKKNTLQFLKRAAKITKSNKTTFLTLIFLTVYADILLIESNSDIMIFGLLFLYGSAIWFYKLKNRLTYIFCLSLLLIMSVSYLFSGTSAQTEKAAVWLYLFLLVGIIQQFRE